MARKDLIKGLPFAQERSNRLSDQDAFRFRKIDTLSGIGQMEKVSLVSFYSVVEIMIEPTMADFVTMVAGADRAVSKQTVLFNIGRTSLRAVSAWFRAMLNVGTDHCRIKSVTRFKGSMLFYFF